MIEAGYGGEQYPNATSAAEAKYVDGVTLVCPEQGCLFNVVDDKTEQTDVSAQHPGMVLLK